MKAAFACRDNRIAPVFDIARRLHIVEVESGRIVREGKEPLPDDLPVQKALRLAELGVGTLVCGAISRILQETISSHGIRVIPFVAGELHEIIKAWLEDGLHGGAFAMPGCRGRRPHRFRRNCITQKEGWDMPGNMSGGRWAGGGGRGQRRGLGTGQGPGVGSGRKGRMGPPDAAGPAGNCVCIQCGHREPHQAGNPCIHQECPKCGGSMGRES
jgi:predicted Fe-Mo cluster-binding NifX family protein